MSKNQESGVSKPMAARNKGKVVIDESEFLRSGEGELPLGDVNSAALSRVTHESKKGSRGKRKSSEVNNIDEQSARSSRVQKKPRIVWTTYLHNLFLLAIKQVGIENAAPKKILEAMNVPYLTRENVASHLQKYRIFLEKVAGRGIHEGLSSRTLRSRFASGLSASVINEIQQRSTERLHFPVQQYLQTLAHQTENRGTANYALKPSNQGPIHLHDQQLYKGLMAQNQQAINGYNSFDEVKNMQQKLLGSYANLNPFYQANLSHNSGPMFPSYTNGMGHHGLMTSSNGLTGSVFQNYDPLGNQSFRYGLGNRNNMASSSSSNNVPWISNSTCYPSSNSYGIQLNGGPQMVETGIKGQFNYNVGINATVANNNSFGLVNGTQNAKNMHVAVTHLEHGNSGLVNGCSASAVGNGCVSEVPAALISNATQVENIPRIPQLPQQLDGLGNIDAGNEHQFYNAGSISESGNSQMEDDLSELFMIVEGTRLLNETEETTVDVSECLNSDSSNSSNFMQSLEQDWDMDLIEAFFCNDRN